MYDHILLAVDFSDEAEPLGRRAVELAGRCGARMSLIHVVEYLPLDLGDGIMPVEAAGLDEELIAAGRERLKALAERLGIPESSRWVEAGSTAEEIHRVAAEEGVDLIVVGRHDRHGLALLLGSTAKSVLHSAPCDVLAIHLPV